jgi:hypothetical protein
MRALSSFREFPRDCDVALPDQPNTWHIWTDEMIANHIFLKKPPLARHMSLRVGTFTRDLPPSKCARRIEKGRKLRERKELAKNKKRRLPTPKPWEPRPERLKGKPAYLKPILDRKIGGITWFWCDCYGKGVDAKFVVFNRHDEKKTTLSWVQACALTYHDTVARLWL